jgi:cell division protein FtsX
MGRLSFVLGAAVRDLRRTGVAGAGAVLLTALTILVVGATLLGREALARLTAAWRAELRIVAVLREEPGAGPDGAVPRAQALPAVAAVRYVSSAEALAGLESYLGLAADGLDRLPLNPVPARLIVTPAAGADAAAVRALVEGLARLPGVEDVQAAVAWLEPVERLERGVTRGGLALGALLGLAALGAVTSATAFARHRRAGETAILRLAGAGPAVLRVPLVLQAGIQGAAGAALGWSALVCLTEVGAPWTAGWLRLALGLTALPAAPWSLTGTLLGGGAALGLLGGLLAGRP